MYGKYAQKLAFAKEMLADDMRQANVPEAEIEKFKSIMDKYIGYAKKGMEEMPQHSSGNKQLDELVLVIVEALEEDEAEAALAQTPEANGQMAGGKKKAGYYYSWYYGDSWWNSWWYGYNPYWYGYYNYFLPYLYYSPYYGYDVLVGGKKKAGKMHEGYEKPVSTAHLHATVAKIKKEISDARLNCDEDGNCTYRMEFKAIGPLPVNSGAVNCDENDDCTYTVRFKRGANITN